jgi:hypothetical protein
LPCGAVDEAVPQQADELTDKLVGVADHFLGRDAATVGLRVLPRGLLTFGLPRCPPNFRPPDIGGTFFRFF